MLYTILILLLLTDCFALMLVILLQSGKGGGLAAGFGGAGTGMEMMGSRQTATFLHAATRWLGGTFLVLSFAISVATTRSSRPRSLIEAEMQREAQEQPAPEATTASPTDLQDILGEPSDEGAPAPATDQDQAAPAGPEDAAPR